MAEEEGKASPPPGRTPGKSLKHELRTPLNQIIGYAEMIEEEAQDLGRADLVADLKKIGVAAHRLVSLIDTYVMEPPTALRTDAMPALPAMPSAAAATPVDAPATPDPVMPRTTSESLRASTTLLVVDDNEMNRDMLSRRLKGKGYAVSTAEDGYKALEMIAAGQFDLILLDIMMPGISGFDVLKKLRETYSVADLPIIMATAKDQSEDTVQALKLGANDYVTKPLDFPVVLARTEAHLGLKRAMEEIRRLAGELEIRNQFIQKTFGRYLSDEVVSRLLETPEGLNLGGERRTLTLMMTDLRGFTAMAERLTPEQVVHILNIYLGVMADIVTKYQGTIDEFIGDAIFALFGAPIARPDDAQRAVACALEMQRAMAGVNQRLVREGLPTIQMGIALNTGDVVVGNIGSETRAKYGVVGSPVNLTARIESYTVGGQILMSQSTLDAAGEVVRVGESLSIEAKGFKEPITIHYLKGIGAPYALDLPEHEVQLKELRVGVSVRFAVLEGKHVGADTVNGAFVRLSPEGAEVKAEQAVEPMTNLRIHVLDREGNTLPGDLYAKVTAASEGRFEVRFTSVPPDVEAFVAKLVSA